jgi:hypothetical protein
MLNNGELVLTINELCEGSVGRITTEIQNREGKTILVITENALFTDKHIQDYSALLQGLKEALNLGAKVVRIELNNSCIINWSTSSVDIPQTDHLNAFHEEVQKLLMGFEEVHWELKGKDLYS